MISTVLRNAADIIDRDGWYDGKGEIPCLHDGNPACLIMAIYRAAGREYNFFYNEAVRAVEKHIGQIYGLPILASWNDQQSDKDDVTGLLRRVADLNDSVADSPH